MKKYENATNSTQSNTQTTTDLATRIQPDIGMLSSSFSTSDTFSVTAKRHEITLEKTEGAIKNAHYHLTRKLS